ncbi:Uma2 family endonuclease [Cryptosporangium japonicum]|uniref:Uma2 family endonuclease n=1 Tax=Cryptosporangium japonicum TaxID=80872 RepID=A0ABP3EY06_9ACTN
MSAEAFPDWMRIPQGEWTADDLDQFARDGWLMHLEMAIRIDRETQLVPDRLVATSAAGIVPEREWFWPIEVALAVEIESPDSMRRDRVVKHDRYARAGIPNYWRIEDDGGVPTVHVHELDTGQGSYVETAVERRRLTLKRPFPMKIDVDELYY